MYAGPKDYAHYLLTDLEVREHIAERLAQASVSRIDIERPAQTARITIHTARPGIVIGKKGEDVDKLRVELTRMMACRFHVNVEEIRKPEVDALLVAQNVAQQLERRVRHQRAMRRVMQNAMRLGAQGIKVRVAGRLNGAEIARAEVYAEGRVTAAHLACGHRLRHRDRQDHLRHPWRQGVDFQRRDPRQRGNQRAAEVGGNHATTENVPSSASAKRAATAASRSAAIASALANTASRQSVGDGSRRARSKPAGAP